jgi:glucose-1-phosphate thymidylyltransferase
VIGPGHDDIRKHYERRPTDARVSISFALQTEPLGTAHALLSAAGFVAGEAFVVLNADTYYPPAVLRELRSQREPALPSFDREALVRESNFSGDRVMQFALLDVDDSGHLRRIAEKPSENAARSMGASAPVSMNVWLFTPEIFEACQHVPPSSRGEMELPNAVQWGIDHIGLRMRAFPVRAGVLDLSSRADVPAVAARLEGVEVRL